MLKHTPLTDIHESLGAKMAPFAGYLMPISYSSIREEHAAVRNGVGVFDVTHMGEFIVKNTDWGTFEIPGWTASADYQYLF